MYVITGGGRGQGKTAKLVIMSSKRRASILCSSIDQIDQVNEIAAALKLKIPAPLLYSKAVKTWEPDTHYMLHDTNDFLRRTLHAHVDAIAVEGLSLPEHLETMNNKEAYARLIKTKEGELQTLYDLYVKAKW